VDEKFPINWSALFSLVGGVVAAFAYQLVVPQVVAVLFGVVAFTAHDKRERGRWMAVVGLILGLLYGLLAFLSRAGYMGPGRATF
jgi:hypothetical protein